MVCDEQIHRPCFMKSLLYKKKERKMCVEKAMNPEAAENQLLL